MLKVNSYLDGIPLDLTRTLLPFRAKSTFSLFTHLYLHAKSQKHYADKKNHVKQRKMSRISLLGLVDSLESAIRKLDFQPRGTEWARYHAENNYSQAAMDHKRRLVAEFLERLQPESAWDLGANTGEFSRIAAGKGIRTISFDIDPACVEINYQKCRADGTTNILPLLLDLTNPSPAIGWQNMERMSLLGRGPADLVMALALIHHLAISNNLPFYKIAEFFSRICKTLIIEFVPKTDSQVQRLLSSRQDIFHMYLQEQFESQFSCYFRIIKSHAINDMERIVYFMEIL